MQKIPNNMMITKQWQQNDLNTANRIPQENFEPLRLRGGGDDPTRDRSLNVAFDSSAIEQLTFAIGPGGDDGNIVSIQSENPKADSLSDSRNDLNNNNDQNQEKNGALDVTKQLEKWNKVRESLYSQYGWSSENVNQNSKWDVDMTTTPTEECQNRDKSVIAGTNQWSNDFPKCNSTEAAITFADLAPPDGWSETERWTANEPETVDREEQKTVTNLQSLTSYLQSKCQEETFAYSEPPKHQNYVSGGAVPRDYCVQPDDAQRPSGNQFANTYNQYRSMRNANDWNKPFPPSNQNENQNRFARPITKKNADTSASTMDGGPNLPHPNDQPTNSFTSYFQQMNLQDNIMYPYQQRFTAQSQPQNHIAQMSPFDFGQNDSFAQNGWEQGQHPWGMQYDRSTMMPIQNQPHNQSFFGMDSAMAQNDLHAASNSRWPPTDHSIGGDASFGMRNTIDLVDHPSTSTKFIPTAATAAATNSSAIPNWQHSSFY